MTSGAGHATDRCSGEVPVAGIGGSGDEAEVARAFRVGVARSAF